MRGYFVRGQGSIHTSAQWESHDRARSLQVHGGQTRYSDVGYFAGFSFVPQIAFDISWSIDMKLAVHSCQEQCVVSSRVIVFNLFNLSPLVLFSSITMDILLCSIMHCTICNFSHFLQAQQWDQPKVNAT